MVSLSIWHISVIVSHMWVYIKTVGQLHNFDSSYLSIYWLENSESVYAKSINLANKYEVLTKSGEVDGNPKLTHPVEEVKANSQILSFQFIANNKY